MKTVALLLVLAFCAVRALPAQTGVMEVGADSALHGEYPKKYQEIIADYVHGERVKNLATVANTFFAVAVGAVGVIAVIKIAAGVLGNG